MQLNTNASLRRRTWRRLTLALVGSIFAASTLLPTGAWAVESEPDVQVGDDPELPQQVPSCSAASWSSPIVKIHVAGFSGDRAGMEDAIRDVNAQIAEVGGSTVRIQSTVTTTEPYHLSPYYDHEPVIHVAFQPIFNPAWAAVTNSTWPCEHFITVDNTISERIWNFGTPTNPETYYEAGKKDESGAMYFRVSYLHELLHALGVGRDADGHPDNVYSFLNYGERPWANAPGEAMIRPLPYDVRELRRLYPGSTARTAVSVLNTWFVRDDSGMLCSPNVEKDPEAAALCDSDPPPSTVTSQKKLCAPSAGSMSLDSAKFAAWCGTANDTSVCPGDVIQVHYALANYSTTSVTVDSNMWLSLDDEWDSGDELSPTTKTYSVGAAEAQNKFWGYEVPSLPFGVGTRTYHVIMRATATTPSGVTVKNSIPMRGTVTVGPECMTAIHTHTLPTRPATFP